MIPGANVLGLAFSIIGTVDVQWQKSNGRTTNELGNHVTTYDPPVTINGSWQPVPQVKYQQLGLDLDKKYFNFYARAEIMPVERATSGDLIIFNGRNYQVEDENDWFDVDGWRMIRCIYIG